MNRLRFILRRLLPGAILFLPLTLTAAVLPEDRADLLYHAYDGGGAEISGPSILVRKDIANTVSVSANYYVDMVSSASIDVITTASPYTEERTQYSLGVDYLRNKTTMNVGFTNSTENDYTANTYSFGVSQDFFGDLTTLGLSFSYGDDTVGKNGDSTFERDVERKQYSLGLSQILTKNWMMNLTIESVLEEGFLNNPYRSVRYLDDNSAAGYAYQLEVYPETRASDAFAIRSMYYLPYRASVKLDYRYYTDTWGIESDTFEIAYAHPIGEHVILDLKLRQYSQTSASFYSDLFPFEDAQNFLARDKEMSTFSNQSVGIGVSYELPSTWMSAFDRSSINLYWDYIQFEYDDFRDVRFDVAPGTEPLYSFDANVIRLFFSVWY